MDVSRRNILCETSQYLLYHICEAPYLKNKSDGTVAALPEHYGDPSSGLIDPHGKWCVVGGLGLFLYDIHHKKLYPFLADEYIAGVKFGSNRNTVKILLDPWGISPGVWCLDIKKRTVRKISSGPDLRDQPYRDEVEY